MDGQFVSDWPGANKLNLTIPEVVDYVWKISWSGSMKRRSAGTASSLTALSIISGGQQEFDLDGDGKPDDTKELDRKWSVG